MDKAERSGGSQSREPARDAAHKLVKHAIQREKKEAREARDGHGEHRELTREFREAREMAEKKAERKRERAKTAPPTGEKQKLKIVVRRLPPNIPEGVFWESVQAWVSEETVTWRTFWPGKLRTRPDKENVPSRAYIVFKTVEQVAAFGREYDGHLFRDKAGNEFQAVVEFAPYQKVPSDKKKVDARAGTIEKDEDYISFEETLKASTSAEPVTLESLLASARPSSPPKTTPLLEALKAEKDNAASRHRDVTGIMKKDKKEKGKAPLPPAAAGPDLKKKKPLPPKAAPSPAQEPKPSRRAHKSKPSTSATGAAPGPSSAGSPSGAPAPLPDASTRPPKAAAPSSAASRQKPRPAINLSRGFEAALSGAMGGGGRGKREPADARPKASEAGIPGAGGSSLGTAATPTSPSKKDGPPPADAPKVPGLISATVLAGASEAPRLGGDVGRGRGRGGRGRGRGRGGGRGGS
ncbi:Smg-4/UPF3 family-domain-containing protein [Schizophyllum amplum]|uniref:Smg-4/UPF3 family-domain-containing protein n=1 Tax=Schizophyllum amplum TaxID=97359 RepID=A0A550CQ17_9AGAR|nr:Smg-4/UPF3 family-domain-containing protein [Auriculariopsis ampla]